MNESEKQFSFTRAASSTSGREKQILISKAFAVHPSYVLDDVDAQFFNGSSGLIVGLDKVHRVNVVEAEGNASHRISKFATPNFGFAANGQPVIPTAKEIANGKTAKSSHQVGKPYLHIILGISSLVIGYILGWEIFGWLRRRSHPD